MNQFKKEIIIVGGGASGLSAAISAARAGASVRILEKKEQAGKKLLITGNGHCNFSNESLSETFYYAEDPAFVRRFLSKFPTASLRNFFQSLGMFSVVRNGGVYPSSNQAATVLSVLLSECKRLNVEIITDCNVTAVAKVPADFDKRRFSVTTDHGVFYADAVILSCGSTASVKDRFPFTGLQILQSFKLKTTPVFPVLTSLNGDNGFETYWAGIRIKAGVTFKGHKSESACKSAVGELQLTDKGISGIPVFQISHAVIEALIETHKNQTVTIDFLPDFSQEDLEESLRSFRDNEVFCLKTVEEILKGILPKKSVLSVLKKCGFSAQTKMGDLSSSEINVLVNTLKSFSYVVSGYGDFSTAQASAGGLSLSEIRDDFSVISVPGLYVTGELLNVDGICGGYNLHFAFSSGIIAGESAANAEANK